MNEDDDWRPIKTCPRLDDGRPFEAEHSKHGICRVQWMESAMVAKCEPLSGGMFFRHSKGNAQNYPSVQDEFSFWRPVDSPLD